MFRFWKTAAAAANLFMIYITYRWFKHGFDMQFSASCLVLSGLWIAVTRAQMGYFLRTYFDTLSRLQVLLPLTLGVVLCGLAIFATDLLWLRGLALLSIAYWGVLYVRYRRNKKLYETQGHGPLPVGTWVNPPVESLQAGDLILTSGNMASRLQESVGHGEIVVNVGGTLKAFSSYMAKGVVMNELAGLTGALQKRGHYIILRPAVPWSVEEVELAGRIATAMYNENRQWVEETTAKRDRILARLPLPGLIKAKVVKIFSISGYDWTGLFTGRRVCNRWTCIGACIELWWRMGRTMRWLGTGMLGLGTGLLDPIMPARLLSDPAFRLLKEADKQAWEKQNTPA
jgi:hypothetical protein